MEELSEMLNNGNITISDYKDHNKIINKYKELESDIRDCFESTDVNPLEEIDINLSDEEKVFIINDYFNNYLDQEYEM